MNKNIELYTLDNEVQEILNDFKKQQKIYNRIIESLNVLGDFENKVTVYLYETKNDNNENYIKLWLNDNNANIFIIYANSHDKKDLYKIEQITNDNEFLYDLSLAKKFKLTKENINFTRSGNIYNFKYGRLITDEKTFYSIYLGDDIGYQLTIDYSSNYIKVEDILAYLNNMKEKPKLIDISKMFDLLFKLYYSEFNEIALLAYKNFIRVSYLELKKEDEQIRKLNKINKD